MARRKQEKWSYYDVCKVMRRTNYGYGGAMFWTPAVSNKSRAAALAAWLIDRCYVALYQLLITENGRVVRHRFNDLAARHYTPRKQQTQRGKLVSSTTCEA